MPRYLLLQRSTPADSPNQTPPSPAQMQEMFARFNEWKDRWKANILDMGGKLTPEIRIVGSEGLMDGPFVESKEIVGGYMIITADSFEQAVALARESPGVIMPGSKVELREIREMGDS